MPNYFTHITFGARVLAALPQKPRSSLERERAAFDLGCLGPDVLFFYYTPAHNQVRAEGMELHHQSALPVFRRLRAGMEAGVPLAGGYAAGFLCHLALDSACHPYVNTRAARGDITHLAMEAELDRLLMERAGLRVKSRTQLPPISDPAVFRAAALAYTAAGPGQIARGYRAMRRDTKLLARFYGTRFGRAASRLSARIGPLKNTVGVILGREPAPASAETTAALLSLLDQSVPTAAEQILRLFSAIQDHAGLDPWLDRDFTGAPAPAAL